MAESGGKRTRVLVIGASARAAAHALSQTGFEPIAFDLFADTDTAAICPVTRLGPHYEGAEEAIRAAQADAWIYTGGLENRPELVDRLAAICPLWGNGGDVLRRVRDPRFLPKSLAADGLRHLPMGMGATGVPTDGSWLRKPIASAGGGRIAKWMGGNKDDKQAVGRWYYQLFREGESQGAVFVADGGSAELIGVTRQLVGHEWTGARKFWYCGSIGPLRISHHARKLWRAIGQSIMRRGKLVGIFGVDAMAREDEILPIEINPRYPSSTEILDAVKQYGAMRFHVAACATRERARELTLIKPMKRVAGGEWRPCVGKAIVFAKKPGKIPAGLPSISDEATHPANQLPLFADIPAEGTRFEAGEPVLTVFAAGNDNAQVEERLKNRCKEVKKWLEERS